MSAASIDKALVAEICDIAYGMKRMALKAREIALEAKPGQFVMVATGNPGAILRRPLGVSGVDVKAGLLVLRFAVAGKGTAWLAERRVGDELQVSGPFGRGFTIRDGRHLLVGGGTGIAPLLFLKDEIVRAGGTAVMVVGAKDKACLMESDTLTSSCVIATEDGSLGEAGFVTGPVEKLIKEGKFDSVMACGPVPMLRAVRDLAAAAGLPLKVSLESHMGCGTGACNGCTCGESEKDGRWMKVCKDGPVFQAGEVQL